MSKERKLKVLVSAYACEPDKGSEPGVGWNWAKQIARFHEVWVITRANNREPIERELQKNPDSSLHFIYYDVPGGLSFWKNKERGLYLYYLLWQIGTYRIAKKKFKKEKFFDLVHYITFGNIWLPTFMSFLKIPFVWGPLGGGDQIPRSFRKEYPLKARIQEAIRDAVLASLKVNPFFLHACKRARFIIVRTEETLKKIPRIYRHKVTKMIETGVNAHDLRSRGGEENGNLIQIISVGRLIHLKGFDLAIKAFAKAFRGTENVRMIIIGDGPDKTRLQEICQKEDVSHMVVLAGKKSHDEVIQSMSESSIFLFPSLKEGGPWVLFEAMLQGLPVICMDIAGMADIVDVECCIKVRPVSPEQTINDLSDALLSLASNPGLRKMMGGAGRKRVEAVYSWDKKGELIKELYDRCLGSE
jgi:glycosyltransferase involved in cell wall biosynthesis